MMIWDKGQDWLRPNNKKQQETSKFEKEMLWLWQWKYVMFYAVPSLALASQKLIKKIQSMQIKSVSKGKVARLCSSQFSSPIDQTCEIQIILSNIQEEMMSSAIVLYFVTILSLSLAQCWQLASTRYHPLTTRWPLVDHSLTTRWPCQWPRWSWHLGAPWNVRPSVCRSGLVVSVRARPKPWIVRSVRCRLCF